MCESKNCQHLEDIILKSYTETDRIRKKGQPPSQMSLVPLSPQVVYKLVSGVGQVKRLTFSGAEFLRQKLFKGPECSQSESKDSFDGSLNFSFTLWGTRSALFGESLLFVKKMASLLLLTFAQPNLTFLKRKREPINKLSDKND